MYYSISGKIIFPKTGALHIQLLDENGYEKGEGESISIIPGSEDISSGYVMFCFTDVPGGNYAIRCYQDVNNNGVMDTGIFGIPVEPCGTYRENTHFGAPKFKNIFFYVKNNVSGIQVELK
jgi:uncharacterized protein (DUF2141 family)